MLIGEGGDLGQVRDAENLLAAAQGLQFMSDSFSGAASDADVDFVEDQRARAWDFCWLGAGSSTATFRASMTRDISPPEAIS